MPKLVLSWLVVVATAGPFPGINPLKKTKEKKTSDVAEEHWPAPNASLKKQNMDGTAQSSEAGAAASFSCMLYVFASRIEVYCVGEDGTSVRDAAFHRDALTIHPDR
jgi:hypothetical protein